MSDVRRTSDPVDEDIEFELNHELGRDEAREINRRVRWAQEQRKAEEGQTDERRDFPYSGV